MGTFFSIVGIILLGCFLWYVFCAESYIRWLVQTLSDNNISVEKDRYGYDRK